MLLKCIFISLLLGITICSNAQTTNDTTAIKQLLETESATWRAGDIKGHATCWLIRPYSKIIISTDNGKLLDIPATTLLNPPAGMMGKGGSATNSNYTFSIQGKAAWVGHNEISIAADGTKSYSYEIRMLEKVNGLWKLIGQSIHAYRPEEK